MVRVECVPTASHLRRRCGRDGDDWCGVARSIQAEGYRGPRPQVGVGARLLRSAGRTDCVFCVGQTLATTSRIVDDTKRRLTAHQTRDGSLFHGSALNGRIGGSAPDTREGSTMAICGVMTHLEEADRMRPRAHGGGRAAWSRQIHWSAAIAGHIQADTRDRSWEPVALRLQQKSARRRRRQRLLARCGSGVGCASGGGCSAKSSP
jgi:hypothetical protein